MNTQFSNDQDAALLSQCANFDLSTVGKPVCLKKIWFIIRITGSAHQSNYAVDALADALFERGDNSIISLMTFKPAPVGMKVSIQLGGYPINSGVISEVEQNEDGMYRNVSDQCPAISELGTH
jgi:hypothetical protein